MTRYFLPGLVAAMVLQSGTAQAECTFSAPWLRAACERIAHVYHDGRWDAYLTGYGWHQRSAYSPDKYSALNAQSWGGGAGKHIVDANGNEDLLFALVFLDSHRHVEPMAGFARQWYTRPVLGKLSFGGGYLAGVTLRADVMGGVPFPLALPLVSVRYARASVMATVIPRIPGGLNAGNVVFAWGRYAF